MKENIFLKHKLKRYNNKEEYLIDIKLRAFLLEILEYMEDSLKQSFINEVGENYDNIDFYRDVFKNDVKEFIERKIKYLKENNEECLNIKGRIEVNIFISKLTFGEISYLLRKLNIKNKKNILKQFGFYKLRFFENWISNIRYLRNLVCHGENIFNRKYEKKIDFYNTAENNNNFKGYFLILGVFCKILGIEEKIKNIGKFLQKKKDAPGVKHISKEIEAWYVLVDTLYDFYVKKSNLNGGKINIIQFLPYYPPHKGGLETHVEQWADNWNRKGYGKVYNIITDFNQNSDLGEIILFENSIIGYRKNGVENLIVPSLEFIPNFPVYKIWNKKYKLIIKYLKEKNINIIITRTRFFLTSLIGGLYAKKNKIKWIHIEHGSDYVKLNSNFKNIIAKIYDKVIGKWIFKKANKIIGVSKACKDFIQKEFVNRKVNVIYRGVELRDINVKKREEIKLVFIGRLVKLKGVEDLLNAYKSLDTEISLDIIGDGEELNNLKKQVKLRNIKNVKFLSFKNKDFIGKYLSKNKCIFINTSYQEGLPTSVIESLFYSNIAIASNVGGTSEISNNEDLILFNAGNIDELVEKINFSIKNYENLVGKSKKIIEAKFSWDKNIIKYYKILNEKN